MEKQTIRNLLTGVLCTCLLRVSGMAAAQGPGQDKKHLPRHEQPARDHRNPSEHHDQDHRRPPVRHDDGRHLGWKVGQGNIRKREGVQPGRPYPIRPSSDWRRHHPQTEMRVRHRPIRRHHAPPPPKVKRHHKRRHHYRRHDNGRHLGWRIGKGNIRKRHGQQPGRPHPTKPIPPKTA